MSERLTILQGDVLARLAELPDASCHLCCTSPPYFALRSYLPADHPDKAREIGLEPQLDCGGWLTGAKCGTCWICRMSAVFSEVKRVLRADGTCWVNVGSSYFGGTPGSGGRTAKQMTNRGSFFAGGIRQNPSLHALRVQPCGSDDIVPGDCPGLGYAYSCLCDECLTDFLIHRDRTLHTLRLDGQDEQPREKTTHDNEQMVYEQVISGVAPPCALVSTMLLSWLRLRGGCLRCENRAALSSPSVLHSSLRSSQEFAHMRAGLSALHSTSASTPGLERNISDIAEIVDAWGFRIADKGVDFYSCIYCTTEYRHPKLKPKDDTLQPARLALALQAQGWYVRSQIVWAKANPMPESVTDRPTSAHETIWLLSKAATYFYDAEAVRESHKEPWRSTGAIQSNGNKGLDAIQNGVNNGFGLAGSVKREYNPAGRNLRNVWNINSHAYPEAHFATFPPEIPKRAILAGTSEKGCCPQCQAPWRRVVEMRKSWRENAETREQAYPNGSGNRRIRSSNGGMSQSEYEQIGWQPSCSHPHTTEETVPATVLDIFAGSGTTGMVALELGRNAVLIELNADYCDLIRKRCAPALAQELLPL